MTALGSVKTLGGVVRERFDSLMVGTAMAVVSFSSGFISYTHISALTLQLHGSWKSAHLYPLCIDGQLVIGSAYFMYGKDRKSKVAGLVFGVIPGIGESLVANWESGIVHGLFAAGWATVPAQAFACSTILFERWLHRRRAESEATRLSGTPATDLRLAEPAAAPAPEPAAPGPEPEAVAPEPVPAMEPLPAWTPGPVPWIDSQPAPRLAVAPKPRTRSAAAQAGSRARPPLPEWLALPEDERNHLIDTLSFLQLSERAGVSKHVVGQWKEARKQSKEVTEDAEAAA
jgi:hypothetical protein